MKTIWTEQIKDEAKKEEYKQSLLRVKWVLEDLNSILDRIEKNIDRNETDPSHYDKVVNWSHKQAHSNGYRQCLRNIKSILDLGEND